MPWWLWVIAGVLALVGEALSMALFLLYIGAAAFVSALLALLGVASAAQFGVFIVLSILLLVLIRPRMLHLLSGHISRGSLTNQGPLANRLATVTKTVTSDGGTVRIGSGEFWTARTTSPSQPIGPGSIVQISYIDGLVAFVEPTEETITASEERNDPLSTESHIQEET